MPILSNDVVQRSLVDTETSASLASAPETKSTATPWVFYTCGPDLVLRSISPNAFELLGIRAEGVTGTHTLWEDRMRVEDRIRLRAKLKILKHSEIASDIHRLTNDTGLPTWVGHSFRKFGRDEAELEILGCMIPLSTNDCIEALDVEVIHQFVHRIGNHFQLINLLIDSLKRQSAKLEEVEALQQTVDRAVQFTQSFSRYSQPAALNTWARLGDILGAVSNSLAPIFKIRNVTIHRAWHPSLASASVFADPSLLELALEAILENAFDASKDNACIVIDGKTETRGLDSVIAHVSIVDTGTGMHPGELAKAAVPFTTSKRDRDGLGLSLAIRIIEVHGGAVNILSAPGHGTKVEVVLPVNEGTESLGRLA